MKHIYFVLMIPMMLLAFVSKAEDPCHVACKQNMPITLGYNCNYTVQPGDILHYPPPGCQYIINVYNSAGQPIGPTVNGSHVGQTLQVKVSYGSWSCWASIVVSGGNGGGPVAICDVNTQVSLSSAGSARVYWQTFDDGSYVNCGNVAQVKIRRAVPGWCPAGIVDDTQFRDYVEFCCEDVANSPIKVILRVYDQYGNYNECWVNVYVEDHLTPHIYCPPDITVSCDYPINYANLHHFGSVHMNAGDVQPIYINDPYYYPNGGHAGYDGYVGGGACGGNYWVQDSYYSDIECGQGTIYRTFTIENTSYYCTQRIFVRDPHPFSGSSIHWPYDVDLTGCGPNNLDPSVTGKPTWYDAGCSLIATAYEDEVFTIEPDACFKVLRTWSVLDWCQYKPNDPYGRGRWNYVQIIKLKNSEAPEFTDCYDKTFCTTEVYGCAGKAPLYGEAHDDCTDDSSLKWHWCIDLHNDGYGPIQGNYDVQGHTQSAQEYYPFGTHKVLWRVEDLCGNYNTCSYLFTVEDCKKPSPVCLGAISTTVMPASGMIELNARHFDASSFDNCTENEDLIFSYSSDVNETTRVFTCNNIGTNQLEIWVTDEAGNQQFCTAFLVLADNEDVCPNDPMPLIYGTVKTINGESLIGSEVKIETGNINIENFQTIDHDGAFDFGSFAVIDQTLFPMTVSKTDDALNGVSVLDLLLMQKHLLEIKTISDPFVLVAADVNGDDEVNALDLLETRHVMLNHRDIFSQNTSWLYLEDVPNMNPQLATRNQFNLYSSTNDPIRFDLVGVKIGDLDGNASLNFNNVDTRSTRSMNIEDQFVSADELIEIPIEIKGSQIAGINLDMNISSEYLTIKSVTDQDGNDLNFEYQNERLRLLHVDAARQGAPMNGIIVHAFVKRSTWLSEAISSKSNANTLVDINEEEYHIGLEFEGRVNQSDSEINVKILPNPFNISTDIVVLNDLGQSGEISIVSQTGHTILKSPVLVDQRVIRLSVNASDLPASGLYWTKIQLGNEIAIEKLMLIK